jgi:hypothetical protein
MMDVAPQIAQNEAACQLDRAEFEIGDSKLLHLRQSLLFCFLSHNLTILSSVDEAKCNNSQLDKAYDL